MASVTSLWLNPNGLTALLLRACPTQAESFDGRGVMMSGITCDLAALDPMLGGGALFTTWASCNAQKAAQLASQSSAQRATYGW